MVQWRGWKNHHRQSQVCHHPRQLPGSEGTAAYDEYAEGYGFTTGACPPPEPKRKGRVESGVKYVKRNFLPLLRGDSVGDHGVTLSGGQIQRIALARAVYTRPNILLPDEATSSLDSESERAVQDALYRIGKEMTALAIAARLLTIMHADKIAVLNEGRSEVIGAHDELLQQSDTYRSLNHHQFAAVNNVWDAQITVTTSKLDMVFPYRRRRVLA